MTTNAETRITVGETERERIATVIARMQDPNRLPELGNKTWHDVCELLAAYSRSFRGLGTRLRNLDGYGGRYATKANCTWDEALVALSEVDDVLAQSDPVSYLRSLLLTLRDDPNINGKPGKRRRKHRGDGRDWRTRRTRSYTESRALI